MNIYEHPIESTREWNPGVITKVHPDTWEVDVRLIGKHSSIVRRCKVVGNFLPEADVDATGKELEKRQNKVIVGFMNGYVQSPVAIPVHNVINDGDGKKDYVYWSEHLKFRITINRDGVLEIRNQKDDLLQIRIEEKDGTIRIDTPGTSIVQKESDRSVTINCEKASINASTSAEIVSPKVDVTASNSVNVIGTTSVSVSSTAFVRITSDGVLNIDAAGVVSVKAASITLS